jgi:peroxiredoxin
MLTMAYTESNMMDLGTKAPDFLLHDTVSGSQISLADVKGENGTVVYFICNHCPYVIHVNEQLVSIAKKYQAQGVGFVAISSNDATEYLEDAPDKMSIVAKVLRYPFPYLYDESQEVAKAYEAACTPDIYVFDKEVRLFYRGRIDASRPKNDTPLTGSDLRSAIDQLLEGKMPPPDQFPSAGCNIKWKK